MIQQRFGQVGHDLLASLVVFLVAIPLCVGIAIVSGAPPTAGLISGIIGGIVVGSLSGSPLQVSGPAAGLAVITFEMLNRFGWELTAIIIVIAGAIQIACGLLKIGLLFRAVAPAVVQGMLAGIGISIVASQLHVAIDDQPLASTLKNVLLLPAAIGKALAPMDGSSHQLAALAGVITLMALLAWKSFAPARLKFVPAPLVGVITAAFVANVLQLDIRYLEIESLRDTLAIADLQPFLGRVDASVVIAAVGLAFVASAETLLSAAAVDRLQENPTLRTQYDRELMAQGVGNMLAGFIGGLPITGVIVRSAANVEAGAKSRCSAILHGCWLLLAAWFFPQLMAFIPTASLAAVLVYTGLKLANISVIRELKDHGTDQVAIYAATLVLIVCTDLLTGVVSGITISALLLLHRFARLEITVQNETQRQQTRVRLNGAATFLRLPKLASCLNQIPSGNNVLIDIREVEFIDHGCLEFLAQWERQHVASGNDVDIDWSALHARRTLVAEHKRPSSKEIGEPSDPISKNSAA